MTKSTTIRADGETLAAALSTAVADLVGCEVQKVSLDLDAPGLDRAPADVRFELRVVAGDEPSDDDRSDDEPAADASTDDVVADDDDRDEPAAETSADDVVADDDRDEEGVSAEELDEEADAAADFLEGVLDALQLPGDLKIRVSGDVAEVEVTDIGSGALIGRRGQTLEAIQELVRSALQHRFERRCRIKIDAEGYRARRLEKLLDKAQEAIDDVLDHGGSERLEPMDVFERKAVHQLVGDHDGVSSHSQGREPGRRVVIEAD